MSVFFLTLSIAFVAVVFCAVGLGIGYILTGKSKLNCKRCGNPEEQKDCKLCGKKPDEKRHT